MKKYLNRKLFTDIDPYEIVKVHSDRKVTIRPMHVKQDDEGNVDFVSLNHDGVMEHTVTKRKDGNWRIVGTPTKDGNTYFFESDKPQYYYDPHF